MLGNSSVTVQLAASQEGLSSMELVRYLGLICSYAVSIVTYKGTAFRNLVGLTYLPSLTKENMRTFSIDTLNKAADKNRSQYFVVYKMTDFNCCMERVKTQEKVHLSSIYEINSNGQYKKYFI
jgi:hypothetical protein